MEFLGQFPLIPEILGYRISNRVRTRVPGSVQTTTTFGHQRISETSSRLAPRFWRSLRVVTVSFLGRRHLSESTCRDLNSVGNMQRHHGGADRDRLGHTPSSITHQPLSISFDDLLGSAHHPISNAVARDGVGGHCDDGYRSHLGEGVAGFTRTWRRVLLPPTWGRSGYRLERLEHVAQ